MGDKTKIEWADATWNPVVGCSRVSEGCRNCYAERLAGGRLKHTPRYYNLTSLNGEGRPVWNGYLRFLHDELGKPKRWKRPRKIFVCDMGDLFHESIPIDRRGQVFAAMAAAPQHIYQVLTKRAHIMQWEMDIIAGASLLPPNLWLGVSVENQKAADERIPRLVDTPGDVVRWISAEPLLGLVDLSQWLGIERGRAGEWRPISDLPRKPQLDWVVVGGESGPGARPMHPHWARNLRDQCKAARVPFFFKQWGEWSPWSGHDTAAVLACDTVSVGLDGVTKTTVAKGDAIMGRLGKRHTGRLLDGSGWEQYPKAGRR